MPLAEDRRIFKAVQLSVRMLRHDDEIGLMRPAEIDRMDITEDDPCLCAVTYLDGEYKRAVSLLYGIAYTVRMSKMGTHRIEGYFDHVVPPLEGFWRQEGSGAFDPSRKEDPEWISVIRLPDFVTKDDFEWAPEEAARKKKADFSKAFFFPFGEGLCVRCLHIGPCDEEPRTIAAMRAFIRDRGYALDLTERRPHHEIYLSDPNKTAPDKLKAVIRLPIRKA